MSVGASTIVLKVADEVLIYIFKFIPSPKNFAVSCKRFSIIARDEHARADWIICQYGRAHALFHAIRLGPSFINLPVAKAIVAKKAILSRYFVQKLLINFGKHDQQLLELKIAHNIMADVLHLFEHRLDDIGNILMESFLQVMQEVPETFLYNCLVETLRPERTYKMNVWDFIFSFMSEEAEDKFNKAFDHHLSNVAPIIIFSDVHIKPLASSPKFYTWVLRKFGTEAPITVLCFIDLLETRASLDIQLQSPNEMNQCTFKAISDTFKNYCNANNFFLPSHLEIISRCASDEILSPLFEYHLPVLFDIEVTYSLPMETIEDIGPVQTTEESDDMQISEDDISNEEQNVSQYEDNSQVSSTKRKPKTENIEEIRESWKQNLVDMHHNSIYNDKIITNSFKNYLTVFVEEKIPQSEEKLMKINQSFVKRRKPM
ncbi:5227_t:CDS:2, partial [Cetraspora pellucida]